jgi:hypothetical protein
MYKLRGGCDERSQTGNDCQADKRKLAAFHIVAPLS